MGIDWKGLKEEYESGEAPRGIVVLPMHPGWVRTDMGGPHAPVLPEEGVRTAVRLATLGPDGPTGKFFHGNEEMPW